MPQDAFTLKHLCVELNDLFKNGKVNRIVQPDNDEVIFTVYTGKKTERLLLSVNPACPRIGVINADKESPLTAPNFCMLLRKHLLSATIDEISLVGFDRIVKIEFTPSNEFFDSEKKTLFVELMGRYSNVILTQNGKILGGNRGINVFDNGVRPLFVGKDYVFPPVGTKKEPWDKSLISYFDTLDENSLEGGVFSSVQGLALSTIREIVTDFKENCGFKSKPVGQNFFDFLNKFIDNSVVRPCVIKDVDSLKDVCVYPYKLISGEVVFFDKLYLAEDWFFEQKQKIKDFTQRKDRLKNTVNSSIKKTKKKLSAICAKERDSLDAETLKLKGELLLANIYKIKQGDERIVCLNYYDNNEVEILLDVNLSPSKNAENYYKKYNKKKRTLEAIKPQKEIAEKELDYLNSILCEIDACENKQDLLLVEEELEILGVLKKQNSKPKSVKKDLQYRAYECNGFTIKVGRNNLENDKLTFSAKAEDVWIHVKDYHSSHVIIESNGVAIPQDVLRVACSICAYYSPAKDGGKVDVVYTTRKNVKKPPKSKPGFCIYENFKSIVVKANKYLEFIKSE